VSDFKKYKGKKGAVTVVRKKGPYDYPAMENSLDTFDKIREGIYEKNSKGERESKLSGLQAIKDVKERDSTSKGRKDFPFFKHSTKGK
jgi:hypothetical protein